MGKSDGKILFDETTHSKIGVLGISDLSVKTVAMQSEKEVHSREYDDTIMDENPRRLTVNSDVFAEEQQARQDALNSIVDSLSAPSNVETIQNFLASGAAQKEKIKHLVNFLADDSMPENRTELQTDTDIFADEHKQQQNALDNLVDSLSSSSEGTNVTMLATGTDHVGVEALSLNVIGCGVLLLVAVVLAVMRKRSHSKYEEIDEHKDFGYKVLYE